MRSMQKSNDPLSELGMHAGAPPYIFRYAKLLRLTMTPEERLLWTEVLSNKQTGYKFRRQHPFYYFILDFYCHQARLSIELDGHHHYHCQNQRFRDIRRSTFIRSMGVREIRFSNRSIRTDLPSVRERIKRCLDDREAGLSG